MKTLFSEYYPPSSVALRELWETGLIVLDTNVLLNLYRLPATARDELFAVLEELAPRLWIPHQAGLEFQRNRLGVIGAGKKITEGALKSTTDAITKLAREIESLEIEKRALGIEMEPILKGFRDAGEKLGMAVDAAHNNQTEISSQDAIRDRLDSILEGKVGLGPANLDELKELTASGDDRFLKKIPPGFMDAGKALNGEDSTFIYKHLLYEKKYGDLIFWRQLLNHARVNKLTSVLLITGDRKEDWWWFAQKKIIGPHPELISEIRREGGVMNFWMYTAEQFAERAGSYLNAKVTPAAVQELKEVEHNVNEGEELVATEREMRLREADQTMLGSTSVQVYVEALVGRWIHKNYSGSLVGSSRFPDFAVQDKNGIEAFEVKLLQPFSRSHFRRLETVLEFGNQERVVGKFNGFSLILVLPDIEHPDMQPEIFRAALLGSIENLAEKYSMCSIVLGFIEKQEFKVWQRWEPIA